MTDGLDDVDPYVDSYDETRLRPGFFVDALETRTEAAPSIERRHDPDAEAFTGSVEDRVAAEADHKRRTLNAWDRARHITQTEGTPGMSYTTLTNAALGERILDHLRETNGANIIVLAPSPEAANALFLTAARLAHPTRAPGFRAASSARTIRTGNRMARFVSDRQMTSLDGVVPTLGIVYELAMHKRRQAADMLRHACEKRDAEYLLVREDRTA